MNDFVETLWTQFGIETEEHLEQIEQLLMAAETGPLGAEGIARLFRSFHSLKGLAMAMDLRAMEAVAHRSEDLLGLVREGSVVLHARHAGLLLEAADALKALRAKAVAQRADDRLPDNLVARLAAACGGEDEPPENRQEPAASAGALHEDPEMLGYFLELLDEQLPALGQGMDRLFSGGIETSEDLSELRRNLSATLDTLAFASDTMGFPRLAETSQALRSHLPETLPDSAGTLDPVLALLHELFDLIRHLESEAGREAGSAALAAALDAATRASAEQLFVPLAEDLAALRERPAETVRLGSAARRLAALLAALRPLRPPVSCDGLYLLLDVCHRALQGHLTLTGETAALGLEIVQAARDGHRASLEGSPLIPAQDAPRETPEQRLRDCLQGRRDGTAEDFGRYLAESGIAPELAAILTPEQIGEIRAARERGEYLYEMQVYMETSPEITAEFLNYASENLKIVTNRSSFAGETIRYEMLLVTPLPRETLEAELRRIDPSGQLIRLGTFSPAPETRPSPGETFDPGPAKNAGPAMLRVPGESLDRFMNRLGDIALMHSRFHHHLHDPRVKEALLTLKRLADDGTRGGSPLAALCEVLDEQQRWLAEIDDAFQGALNRLQDEVMALRVVPIETVFRRFPRLVRDLAQSLGKRVRLELSGQEVKIDKAMVEVLADPLMHMVRNSLDHGIEPPEERRALNKPEEAVVRLRASQQVNRVVVQVSDDGRGIDPEKILARATALGLVEAGEGRGLSPDDIYRFLFLPGFSTARQVTETSGRGVGLDVVRENIARLGGSIQIHSEPGRGTTFTLEAPSSAAVQQVLMVRAGGQELALPSRYVAEIAEFEDGDCQWLNGRTAILRHGAALGLAPLGAILGFGAPDAAARPARERIAVILANGQRRLALEIEQFIGHRDLYVKDIHPRLAAIPGVGGAAIQGNGRVVLILDSEDLFRLAEQLEPQDPTPKVQGEARAGQ
jgi:two-component system chemotaxis sensor kinase CheA